MAGLTGVQAPLSARRGPPNEVASGTDWRTRRLTVYADPSLQDAARATSAALSRAFDTASVVCQILPPHGSHVYPKPECFSDSEWYRYDTVPEATSFGEFHPVDQPESGKARLNIRHECVEFGGVERAPGHVDREGMGGAGEGFESGDVVSGCESKNAVSDGSLGAVTVRGGLCRCTKIEGCALFEFYKTPKQANPILFFGRLLCGRRQRLKLTCIRN